MTIVTEYEKRADLVTKIIFVLFITVLFSDNFLMHFVAYKSDLLVQNYSYLNNWKRIQLIVLGKL